MACKDRQKDMNILKIITERNASKRSGTPLNFRDISWEGNLLDVQFYISNLDSIIHINKINPGNYIATIAEEVISTQANDS